jgi:hypothetical protein
MEGKCQERMMRNFTSYYCGKPAKEGTRCGIHSESRKRRIKEERDRRWQEERERAAKHAVQCQVQKALHDFWCQVAIVVLMKRIFQLSAREDYEGWTLVPELA